MFSWGGYLRIVSWGEAGLITPALAAVVELKVVTAIVLAYVAIVMLRDAAASRSIG